MAYNNYPQQQPRQQQWQGAPYKQPYNQPQQQIIKRSGATYTKMRKGKHEGLDCVNAWKAGKNGMLTASAFPVDGVIHVGKDKGHEFMRYVVTVTNASMGTNSTYWCLMRLDTKKINISELGLVITPNGSGFTKSGKRVTGFFGKNFKSR